MTSNNKHKKDEDAEFNEEQEYADETDEKQPSDNEDELDYDELVLINMTRKIIQYNI